MPEFNFATLDNENSIEVSQKQIIKEKPKTHRKIPKKIDQKNLSEKYQESSRLRNSELVNYINGMFDEVQSYGRVIPIDTKQSIVNGVLDNLLNLKKGIRYYLNAWESRYNRYLKEKPENPLIDDYRDMQKTLDFLLKLKKLKELIQKFKKSNL